MCDGHETQPYYRAPHGECHKGVGGRRFVTAEKSAAQIPTLTEIDAMFFLRLQMANGHVVVCKKKGGSMPKRRRSRSLACKGT